MGETTWQMVALAFITAIPGIIAAIKANAAEKQSRRNTTQLAVTHDLINSRMTELLNAATSKATAEATIAEQTAQKLRDASPEVKGKK